MGIIAYEVMTGGRHPHRTGKQDSADLENPTGDQEPTAPSTYCDLITESLDRLILQLIRHDPAERPQAAGEVHAALLAIAREPKAAPAKATAIVANSENTNRVLIPGGFYHIGSQASCRFDAEKPLRRIELSDFHLSVYPVTNKEYRDYTQATGRPLPPLGADPVYGRDDHPVVMVSWQDATDYAAWTADRT